MNLLKRVFILAVAVAVAVGTRAVVRYGVRGLFDRITNSAQAQPDDDTKTAGVAPKPVTSGISMGGPLGAGAKAAARSAVGKANAQLAEQTGQEVPTPASPAPAPAPTPAVTTPAAPKMVAQQGAPQGAPTAAPQSPPAAKRDSSETKNAKPAPAATTVAATPASTASKTVFTPQPARSSGDSARSLVMRETFAYTRDARRDPFISLMTTSDLRPTMSDLRLTGILYDLSGRRPVAILRDLAGGQWRVTTGMTLGRMRVAQIKPKTVIFTIEEFGFSRNDSLLLGDTTRVRVPR